MGTEFVFGSPVGASLTRASTCQNKSLGTQKEIKFNKDPYLITRNKELCILECRVFHRIWMGSGQTWLIA